MSEIIAPPAGQRSGEFIREQLLRGVAPDRIVELVRASYPTSKATKGDVAWQRGWLKKHGQWPPTQAPVIEVELEAPAAVQERQPTRHGERASNDPDRIMDRTSLRGATYGQWVHRDYAAHFFRWGFAGRFVDNETEVLDVGCGVDCAFVGSLTFPRNVVPKRYVGVDLNREPSRVPSRQWAELKWEFNFLERYWELGQFDLVTNFEVIEHLYRPDGLRLLAGLRGCLKPTGTLLLSTPVFNGKAAANHLHEWTVPELRDAVEDAGLKVVRRHGTFASQRDLKAAASPKELAIVDRLAEYYSGEVLACFLAPLYPDASRNNVWVCQREDAP